MKSGEHWYAMLDPEGKPQGYARLRVRDLDAGSQQVDWDLHLAFAGGTYEEARSVVHEADGRMRQATYADGEVQVEGTRQGDRLVGVVRRRGEEAPLDLEISDRAIAGMGFVLAADLPFETGYEREHDDHNEAREFEPAGTATLGVRGEERLTVGGVEIATWKMVLTRSDGRELPIWVDAERRIVQTDWGGGNLMVLRDASTTHLFRSEPKGDPDRN